METPMIPLHTFNLIVIGWIIAGLIIFPATLNITAPYGRHTKKGWGPLINNRVAWVLMEVPVLLIFAIFFLLGSNPRSLVTWIFFTLFMLHYVHRVFIFPLRIRTKGKKMPVSVMLMGVCFNLMNGFLIGYWFGHLSPLYSISWLYDPRFIKHPFRSEAYGSAQRRQDRLLHSLWRAFPLYILPEFLRRDP